MINKCKVIIRSIFKLLLLCVLMFFLSASNLLWSQVYRTQIFDNALKTLQIGRVGEKYSSNTISLVGNERLSISFDEMSHNTHAYSYKVIHCNADWTASAISTSVYLDGFVSSDIFDYSRSNSTTFLYTHYKFELPNDNMKFKISGNYVVLIYEDNKINTPVAQVCLSVYEPKISVEHNLRFNTDVELNGRYQQLDFDLRMTGVNVQVPQTELTVLVRQNNRIDNEVFDLKPTYINGSTLSFKNNSNLIFEGGNEFHTIDISSVYVASRGIDKIKYQQPYYEVYLTKQPIEKPKAYVHEFDANGKFVINTQEAVRDKNTEADYMYVNFYINAAEPFLDGRVYVGGDLNYNLMNQQSIMKYDFDSKMYTFRALLKQGGYSYQYRFLRKGESKLNVEKIEGSFWQTTNEYSIYVYYRPMGAQFDRLIGVKYIEN